MAQNSGRTLYDKIWQSHTIDILPTGQTQLFIGLHLIHEITTAPAFDMLREKGLKIAFPERTFATLDHIVPTDMRARPFLDSQAEELTQALEKNVAQFGVEFFGLDSDKQGIVHVIGPQLGLTQPGMTLACGDSHTSTHGAFGMLAFGIGTSQVRDVLATQSLAMDKLKVRRINVSGALSEGVYAKDVILNIIRRLGVAGGKGFAYEYGGAVVEKMSMEERMTVCNMSIEGGAMAGYVNPDETTFAFLKGREFAPKGADFEQAVAYWKSVASDPNARYDDVVEMNGSEIEPTVTWGINPGQAVGISEKLPLPEEFADPEGARKAYEHMGWQPGKPILGTPVDVAFIGSCTNSRLSDLRAAAKIVKGRRVQSGVRALVVPGSAAVKALAEKEGLDRIFTQAGFEWREAGCSMCLAMNPDKLQGREICASSSNRNFIGRQGSPGGRTILMSPAMAAAAALSGKIVDVREYLR
ncbi:MAG: 3-isopropylmalate dehydratase large subunit [Deltaproteobacteria bacterium]|nr:3-isopropylmalate dehydratase large subunit [Deltaproteobacteria bacterium]MBI2992513.1 3-isopropylmalate dehydratase large subunit [Deltaproteobacteria bacterium]